MLVCRALRTFESKYGPLRAGERVTVDPAYFNDVNRRGPMLEEVRPNLEPPRRQVLPGAPQKKDATTDVPEPLPSSPQPPSSDAPPIDGSARPASSSRAAPRSRKRMLATPEAKPERS